MIKPLKMKLPPRDGFLDCHRPDISVWDDEGEIAVSIGPLMGEQLRFIDLTPDEARLLAQTLEVVAALVEAQGSSDD
jgi:hypothetical protein